MKRLVIGTVVLALAGFAAPVHAASVRPARASATTSHSTKYLLAHVPVKALHLTGYVRTKFKLWESEGNGCNAREVVLYRDAKVTPKVGSGCKLTGGKWISPYDGISTTNPTDEQIDHVVPLADAWYGGAWHWTSATREAYANDLGTTFDLLAVSGHSNESKGDKTPDQWLPPKTSFDCRYMADYVGVLWRWKLAISSTQETFLHSHLASCGWPKVKEPKRPTIHRTSGSSGGGGGTSSPPPTTHSCTTTSSGSCIKAGEFCKQADYGQFGYDADGDKLECTGSTSHPHWEDA